LPGVEIDGEAILTNREILAMKSIPKSLVVVGCGAVGVEFASLFHTFGSEVHTPRSASSGDSIGRREVSAELEKSFRKKGIRIELEAKVESVKKNAQGATVSYKDKSGSSKSISAEKVLIAVGRRPLTENIGLEKRRRKSSAGLCTRTHILKPMNEALRNWRHRRGTSAARSRRFYGGNHRRLGRMAGKPIQPFRPEALPERHLLRTSDRLDWINGETGAGSWLRCQNRQIPISRQ